MKAPITISQEFDTIKCEHCLQEFILLHIWRGRADETDYYHDGDRIIITPQVSIKPHEVYCPYCGKKTVK